MITSTRTFREAALHEDLPDRIVNQQTVQVALSGEGDSQGDYQPQTGVNSLVPYGSM